MEKQVERNQQKNLKLIYGTLNRKILELSSTNPQLYSECVRTFPYKPKQINIDIENLAIAIIEQGLAKVIEDTGLNKMTISRKIKKLKEINPELYNLYRKFIKYCNNGKYNISTDYIVTRQTREYRVIVEDPKTCKTIVNILDLETRRFFNKSNNKKDEFTR